MPVLIKISPFFHAQNMLTKSHTFLGNRVV